MTIVVGYIPTPEGLAAVDRATERAQSAGQRLVIVNTGHLGNTAHPHYASEKDLDALVARLTELGIEHELRQQESAVNAAEEILGAAKDTDADLIVIGVRRRSPVGKLVTGSTAQAVLLEAQCDVLAVKAPVKAPEA